jgi:hypothetical protein
MEDEYQCGRCGSSVTFEMCQDCGGDGYFEHDCFDDSCCCLDPEDEQCCICEGEGTIAHCLSSPEWCKAHPMPGRETTLRSTVESFSVPGSILNRGK